MDELKDKQHNDDTYFAAPSQSHLIKACIGTQRESVAAALTSWKKEQALTDVDAGSLRLVPMLSRQLTTFNISDPNMAFYTGVYKKSWLKNKLLFNQLARINDILNAEGIPFLVLKGAALSVLYYHDNGLRPMDDLDILVPENQLQRVIVLLKQNGWHYRRDVHHSVISKYFHHYKHIRHAIDLENGDGFNLDLHWKPFSLVSSSTGSAEVWLWHQPFKVNGYEFRTANHEFQLFQTIIHGIRPNNIAPIRWVVDASVILKTVGDSFNWENFIELTKAHNAAFFIGKGIAYLATFSEIRIPLNVRETISALPIDQGNDTEFNLMKNGKRRYYYYYYYWVYYLKLRATRQEWAATSFLPGYVSYVRLKTNMRSFFWWPYHTAKILLTGKK